MKGIIIISRFWTKLFSFGKAKGITLFPFVFLLDPRDKDNKVLLNHERIHLKQAVELLIVPFYLCYILEFGWRYLMCRNFNQAYRRISFEREAYTNERNLNYLQDRPIWSFCKYL